MNNDTPSAVALARWLEEHPGTPPPPEVDPEVVQAVYALRPELAPAPRLSADDILATITRGPLADPRVSADSITGSVSGAEVVPFPQRHHAPEPASEAQEDGGPARKTARQGRWLRWIGGPGGIGMALVAAATILLVATPILKSSESVNQPGSSLADGEAPLLAPAARERAETTASPAASAPAAPQAAAGEAAELDAVAEERQPPRVEVDSKLAESVGVVGGQTEVITMDERATVMEQPLIPELQDQLAAEQGVASADVDDLPADPSVSEGELDVLRAKATRRARDTGWRKDVPAEMAAEVELALKEADALRKAGNAQAAGDRLKPLVKPPARVGQALAALAAEHYLAAGNADAAVGVAEMGLTLSNARSAERSQLQVLMADGLRQLGSLDKAADLYRQAQ
jgi:hypothetical protein